MKRTLLAVGMSAALALSSCADDGGGSATDSGAPTTSAGASATGGEGGGESVELTYASVVGETDTFARQAIWFMEETEKRSDNRISWEQFWSNSLLGPADMFEGIQGGRADAGHVANVYAPQNLPLSQVTVPFMSSNGEAVVRTLQDVYESNDAFREEWEGQGVKVLAFGLVGNATVGVKDPVAGLSDFDGKRLRAVGLTGAALQAVGVEPSGMAVNEVYEAVQRGVVDGYAGLPFQTAVALKMPEVMQHFVETKMGVFAIVGVVSMSMETWDALPADLQSIMLEVGREVTDNTLPMVEEAGIAACDQLLESGGDVVVLPEDELGQWRDDVFEEALIPQYKSDAVATGVDQATVDSFLQEFRDKLDGYEADSEFVDPFTACAERT